MTAPELEQQFCDCASLFLARVTTWIRLTYVELRVASFPGARKEIRAWE